MIFDQFGMPGMGDPIVSTENCFWFGRPGLEQLAHGALLSSSLDSTNTPTTTLRGGIVVGQITTTKKFTQYSATATDGSQNPIGFLMHGRNMLDPRTGTAGDRMITVLVGGLGIKTASVYGFDETARRLLGQRGFMFDDFRNPTGDRLVQAKSTSYTVLATDHGNILTATGAATFTLPALASVSPGWNVTIFNEADNTITVAAPANKLVCFNNATATSVALSTGGNKIGSGFKIVMNADATKFLAFPIGAGTVTVA